MANRNLRSNESESELQDLAARILAIHIRNLDESDVRAILRADEFVYRYGASAMDNITEDVRTVLADVAISVSIVPATEVQWT